MGVRHGLSITKNFVLAAAATMVVLGPIVAQTPDAVSLDFEVASIHRVDGQRTYVRIAPQPAGFLAEGATVRVLVQFAYRVQYFQISGGPDWVGSRDYPYDVRAKSPGAASEDEIRRMVQTLLRDRFHLRFHRQSKDSPGYALAVAKRGAMLKESAPGDATGGLRSVNPLIGQRMPIKELVDYLSAVVLSVPVVDQTGLQGLYDFTVRWTPDETQFRGAGGRGFYSGDPNGSTIFTAFEEQLGLTLEARKLPTDFIVIDEADQPSEN